jgi:hypothetical protein
VRALRDGLDQQFLQLHEPDAAPPPIVDEAVPQSRHEVSEVILPTDRPRTSEDADERVLDQIFSGVRSAGEGARDAVQAIQVITDPSRVEGASDALGELGGEGARHG